MKNLLGYLLAILLVIEIFPQQNIGKHTLAEWRYIIDTTWGAGQTTVEKLQTFDAFWNTIDQKYAGFNGIVDNWQQLRSYRDTVALGVSRGRFAGILDYLVKSLQDPHVWMLDQGIATTALNEGVPLLYSLGASAPAFNWEAISHFGAGLSPLPDSTLLVYAAVPNHPLGLVPGDVILGYDGRLWKNLYKELLEVQFPIPNRIVMYAAERAATHQWLQCAGMNWHLFDTIDVVKYETGDTLHFPTTLLSNPMPSIYATEQLPIDGVLFPDVANGHYASHGYVNGTNIGYIYCIATNPEAGQDFLTAINSFMPDSSSEALIIDMRLNQGGGAGLDIGLRRLFNQNVETMRWARRVSVSDHLALQDNGELYLTGSDAELYDRPIAVLCGPGAASGGDATVNVLRSHPMVRTFGLPTNGAFATWTSISGLSNQWVSAYATSVLYTPPDINNNLNHKSVPVDEEVWLTREGVVIGQDDVVKSALEWINNLVYPHNIITNKSYYSPQEDTVHIYTTIENPNSHQLSSRAYLKTFEGVLIDSVDLARQTLTVGEEQWTGDLILPTLEEFYNISVTAFDQTEITSFSLPNATKFTTAGPLIVDSIAYAAISNFRYSIKPYIRNNGTQTQIENITIKLICTDPWVTDVYPNQRTCPNLAPGQILGLSQLFAVTYDSATFPGYFNLTFEISSTGQLYWTDSIKSIVTGIDDGINEVPTEFSLAQNYPNPFNPTTTIKYSIPKLSFVTIKIYDVLGREVATLVNEEKTIGNYKVEFNGSNLSSGIYFYTLKAGKFTQTRKLVLMK